MTTIKRASLQDIRAMKDKGELATDLVAKPGEDLGTEFWAGATLIEPTETTSVRLNLDPEVFEFFKSQGKGHITRMQNVLKMYVDAHTKGRAS